MRTTIALGVLFAFVRIWMGFTTEPTQADLTDVFKDAVHVYMGSLGVLAWQLSPYWRWHHWADARRTGWCGTFIIFWLKGQSWQWWLFWSLCVIEVAVAMLQRI